MKKPAALLALPMLLLALTSCGTINNAWDGMFGGSLSTQTSGCPQVAIVRDLSIYQNPPAADDSNVVINARMGNVRGGCTASAADINVDATVDIAVMRGPQSASTRASLPIFVSVLDQKDNVITKNVYEIPVDFENGARNVRISSPVRAQFTIKPDEDGATWRVLVGFHLNAAQVDANTKFFATLPKTEK